MVRDLIRNPTLERRSLGKRQATSAETTEDSFLAPSLPSGMPLKGSGGEKPSQGESFEYTPSWTWLMA